MASPNCNQFLLSPSFADDDGLSSGSLLGKVCSHKCCTVQLLVYKVAEKHNIGVAMLCFYLVIGNIRWSSRQVQHSSDSVGCSLDEN